MNFTQWLRFPVVSRPNSARRRPPVHRPALERLEDRTTPSTGGLLDPTFGSGGHVLSSFSNYYDAANAVTVQPDGKIVIAGNSMTSGSRTYEDFLVARYNADGTSDTSFGSGGRAVTDFSKGYDYAYAVTLQPQASGPSKILAAGMAQSPKGDDFGLARYTATGTLDTTFGSKGKVMTDLGGNVEWAESMVVDGSGRILVAGFTNATGSGSVAALVRYTANGALDTTFGSAGQLVTSIGTNGHVSVALQPDGKIVLAGTQLDPATNTWEFLTARFNANGTADSTFGSGGVATAHPGFQDSVGGITIDGSGRILVAGWEGAAGYCLLRYTPGGTLDGGFGSGGIVTLINPAGWHTASGTMVGGVAVQPDGMIVVGGQLYDDVAQERHVVAVRVSPTGTVDAGYGDAGWASTQFGFDDEPQAMALQQDGRLVLAGYARPSTNTYPTDVALVRFLASAPQVGSFTASPNPVLSGSSLTLTASNITDGNPNSTITQVAFYYIDGSGTQQLLGYGTQTSAGVWTFTFTVSLAPGSYTLFAQAEDNFGVFGDLAALSLQVL
jgi:uncharacterized delta-60 repeat protein